MNSLVSKFRSRGHRARRKANDRIAPPARTTRRDHPLLGILMALSAWAIVYLLILMHRQIAPGELTPWAMVGTGIVLATGLGACLLLLKILDPKLLRSNSKILVMLLIFLISTALIQGALYLEEIPLPQPVSAELLLPLALAPLLGAFLLGTSGGIAVGLWSAFSTAVMMDGPGQHFRILATGMLVTVTVTLLAGHIRKRSSVLRIGLVAGLAQIVCLAGFTLFQRTIPEITIYDPAILLANGILCAILALTLLPVFEMLFDITTDVSLIELSDLGHPLLQRLAIEAPGTYHHSLVVATLSQTACEAIGANGLLARVSAYFHDIGKLTKPEYFTENIQTRQDPHENLTPTMSALLIVAHVKEGIGMAIRQRLPRLVMDAIERHHGTGLVSYFHHKALQHNEREQQLTNGARRGAATVSEESFRYPGPLPVTRETSIIALADAIEAASRTLIKPTPGHIEELVNDITHRKWMDHQLDDSELTLAELRIVKRSFVFTLMSMLHSRIPYPKNGENSTAKPSNPNPPANGDA